MQITTPANLNTWIEVETGNFYLGLCLYVVQVARHKQKGSIDDPTFGARTIQEIAKFSTEQKFNCKEKPLFDFLPMDHVLINA